MLANLDFKVLYQKYPEKIFKSLETSKGGLSQGEAARRLKRYGPNEFRTEQKIRPVLLFLSKFKSPLLILLIVAAVISGFFGSSFDSIAIIVIVLSSTFIDFLNTYKSSKAAEKLKEKVNITAAISRGKEFKEYKMQDVVPGDIFELAAGDLVP